MKSFMTVLAIFSLSTESLWAQSRNSVASQKVTPVVVTTTLPPSVTTTTLAGANSIKDAAVKAQANSKKGNNSAKIAISVAAAGVAIACLAIKKWDCPWWVAGLAAGVGVLALMTGGKKNADNVYNSVAVGDGLCPTCTTAGVAQPEYDEYGLEKNSTDPETRRIQANLAALKQKGITIDPANGKFKTADGKDHFLSDYLNADGTLKTPPDGGRGAPAMPTSGAGSLADFKALNSNLTAATKAAADGLESASAFDDNLSASGGKGATGASAADGAGLDGAGFGGGEVSGVGEERLPAESVDGLTRKYGDSNIGVATDTLWVLVQRRYKKIKDGGAVVTTVKGQ